MRSCLTLAVGALIAAAGAGAQAPASAAPDSLPILLDQSRHAIATFAYSPENDAYARRSIRRALQIATLRSDLKRQYLAHALARDLFRMRERPDSTLYFARQAAAVARRLDDFSLLRDAEIDLASALWSVERKDTALVIIRGVVAEAKRRGDSASLGVALLSLSTAYDSTRADSALAALRAAVPLLERARDTARVGEAYEYVEYMSNWAARNRLAARDTSGAIAILSRAADHYRGSSTYMSAYPFDTTIAALHLARGQRDSAVARLRMAMADLLRRDARSDAAQLLPRLMALEQDAVPADTTIRRLRLQASLTREALSSAEAYLRIADLYQQRGEVDSAKVFLEEAAAAASNGSGGDAIQWLAQLRLAAAHYPRSLDSARTYARNALSTFLSVSASARSASADELRPVQAALADCRDWTTMLANLFSVEARRPDAASRADVVALAWALEGVPDAVRRRAGTNTVRLFDSPFEMARVRSMAFTAALSFADTSSDDYAIMALVNRDLLIRGGDARVTRVEVGSPHPAQCSSYRPSDPASGARPRNPSGAGQATLAFSLVGDTLVTWMLEQYASVMRRTVLAPQERALVTGSASDPERLTRLLFPAWLVEALPKDGALGISPAPEMGSLPFASLVVPGDSTPLGVRFRLETAPTAAALFGASAPW